MKKFKTNEEFFESINKKGGEGSGSNGGHGSSNGSL
jgi:hypothetical protein